MLGGYPAEIGGLGTMPSRYLDLIYSESCLSSLIILNLININDQFYNYV